MPLTDEKLLYFAKDLVSLSKNELLLLMIKMRVLFKADTLMKRLKI
jgi:hypothetical protein